VFLHRGRRGYGQGPSESYLFIEENSYKPVT
jgi:hypothetical protein